MVCFRYIIVNTQHKGENKDDDDEDGAAGGGGDVMMMMMMVVIIIIMMMMMTTTTTTTTTTIMHGQFYWDLERPSVDKEKYLVWLCDSGLKGYIESLIIQPKIKHSIHVFIKETSLSNQLIVIAGCAVREKNT